MSDSEDENFLTSLNFNKPRIHFGSLEEEDKQKKLINEKSFLVKKIIKKGLILEDLSSNSNHLTTDSIPVDQAQLDLLESFEQKKKKSKFNLPTDDKKVRSKLQSLGEPQFLFGEDNGERRDRLRSVFEDFQNKWDFNDFHTIVNEFEEVDKQEVEDFEEEQEFLYPGDPELLECRRFLTAYSLPRAKERLELQSAELELMIPERKKIRHELYTHLKSLATFSSQFGDDRPLSYCTFAPNSKILATGSWSGPVKLWSVPESELLFTLKGHKDRVSGIDFHPLSTISQKRSELNLVSSGTDGKIHGWAFNNEFPICEFEGHEQRVSRVCFHPSGKYLASSSFDLTWRLWDVETQHELLLQEGHSREVFGIGFQCDGSLIATGGKDSIGRVWDLRTGRSIMVLQGHVKSILSLDWSPNGYQLATGSEDHTIRIWDLRGKGSGCISTIPAHTNLVSQVKYFKAGKGFLKKKERIEEAFNFNDDVSYDAMETEAEKEENVLKKQLLNGSYLVSSSYDNTCKVWTEGDFKSIKVLSGMDRF
ncbi:U4/U6 small nuclear ribonucleoprotein Prp4 [Lobulomyces angularis]|nr:U4/U6 small nuclear ribonucleoprotein Prp4 [Lobulomyces angularis]